MDQIYIFTILGLLFALASGCSSPEGGFIDPGVEGQVYYSDIVAVGTVTEITEDPSFFNSFVNSTYGATVVIWCSYKGGELPRTIQIGEAGYAPGMCLAYDLDLNEEYILFLNRYPGNEYYVQIDVALNIERLDELKNVCDLDLKYPTGPGMGFEMCPNPTTSPNCLRYLEPEWKDVDDVDDDDPFWELDK